MGVASGGMWGCEAGKLEARGRRSRVGMGRPQAGIYIPPEAAPNWTVTSSPTPPLSAPSSISLLIGVDPEVQLGVAGGAQWGCGAGKLKARGRRSRVGMGRPQAGIYIPPEAAPNWTVPAIHLPPPFSHCRADHALNALAQNCPDLN